MSNNIKKQEQSYTALHKLLKFNIFPAILAKSRYAPITDDLESFLGKNWGQAIRIGFQIPNANVLCTRFIAQHDIGKQKSLTNFFVD